MSRPLNPTSPDPSVVVSLRLTPGQRAALGATPAERTARIRAYAQSRMVVPLYLSAPGPGTEWFAEAMNGSAPERAVVADYVQRRIEDARALLPSLGSVWEVDPVGPIYEHNGKPMVNVRYVRCVWVKPPSE